MTEAEWLAETSPMTLLAFLEGKISDRKLRLFAVSVTRRYLGELFPDEYGPRIAKAEEIADGAADVDPKSFYWLDKRPARAVASLAITEGALCGRHANLFKCGLLRDIFGNPFRPVTFSTSWRTSTTVALAAQMYESRDFGAIPILADALQDAGCDSANVLEHCRGPGPHVRGCWVVDLVLGKE